LKPNTDTASSEAFEGAAAPFETDLSKALAERRQPLAIAAALTLLRGYKLLFSPLFAGSCRFLPSCSDYAREAVIRHGVVAGSWLAAKRLGRCHPFCEAGYDPVPPSSRGRFQAAAGPSDR
jgi:putative membrane protein insertion efficiency factor